MDRKSWIFLFILLIGLGVGFHGLITDTGPVGWLNALQQQFLGWYLGGLSFMVVAIALTVAGLVIWQGLVKVLGIGTGESMAWPDANSPEQAVRHTAFERAQPPYPEQARPTGLFTTGRAYFLTAVVITALTWIIGGAVYGWHVHTLREDAAAIYAPLELTEGKPLPALSAKHLALRGIPVPELAVVFKTGTVEDYRLIPVVDDGWEPDHPVQVVAKLDYSHPLPEAAPAIGWSPRIPSEIRLLVRRLGPVPLPAFQEFKRMRAPLAGDVIMVSPVATKDGQPLMPDTGIDLLVLKIVCGCITVVAVIWTTVQWLRRRSALRKPS